MFLTPRQQLILKAIVEDYVQSVEPVGSRALSKKMVMNLSPATLRNEMADLEEGGFLRQPHTSAGRIPSDAGYRLFVDLLMEPESPLPLEELAVLDRFQIDARDLDDILQQTAKVTAVLAQCTAIVKAPRLQRTHIQYIQLLPLSEQEALLVLVTDAGPPLHQLVHLEQGVGSDELGVLTNFLNEHLRMRALDQLTGRVLEGLLSGMEAYEKVLRTLWQRLHVAQERNERVYVGNASFLAQQPEFGESHKLGSLLCLLEREQVLSNLLCSLHGNECSAASVSIGHENPLPDLHECSLVSATYSIGGRVFGELGVLGPTRMAYPRALAVVETMAKHLSDTLTKVFGYRAPL